MGCQYSKLRKLSCLFISLWKERGYGFHSFWTEQQCFFSNLGLMIKLLDSRMLYQVLRTIIPNLVLYTLLHTCFFVYLLFYLQFKNVFESGLNYKIHLEIDIFGCSNLSYTFFYSVLIFYHLSCVILVLDEISNVALLERMFPFFSTKLVVQEKTSLKHIPVSPFPAQLIA